MLTVIRYCYSFIMSRLLARKARSKKLEVHGPPLGNHSCGGFVALNTFYSPPSQSEKEKLEISSIHPSIRPFVHLLKLEEREASSLSSSLNMEVYNKPTHTDQNLLFDTGTQTFPHQNFTPPGRTCSHKDSKETGTHQKISPNLWVYQLGLCQISKQIPKNMLQTQKHWSIWKM